MRKRFMPIVMCLIITIQTLQASAFSPNDFSNEEELRLAIKGDEKWTAQFPNGLFNFMGTQFEMKETNKFLEIPIMRQGGTAGRISVDFKAIGISAKYGEDYVIRIYENAARNQIKCQGEAETLAEGLNRDGTINISEQNEQGGIYEPQEQDAISETQTDSSEEEITTESAPSQDESSYTELPKNNGQGMSLRQLRESYLGKRSDRPDWKRADQNTVENLKSEYDTYLGSLPGTEGTLIFEEGEYIKYIYIVPLDDKISESDEQIMLSLSNPDGGASRGEFYMAYVNIKDNEKAEQSLFEIATPSVTAKDGKAEVTVRRKGGINHYSSVKIGTKSGTALAGTDYEPGYSELLFTPGMETQKVIVNVKENQSRNIARQFRLALDQENSNVNTDKAEAVVTLPESEAKNKLNSLNSGLSSETQQNIQAEKITDYGYSNKKGTWTISGLDFSNDAMLFSGTPPTYTKNGLKYEIKSANLSGISYLVNSLAGVDRISFNIAQTDKPGLTMSVFSLNRAINFITQSKSLHKLYKDFDGNVNKNYVTPNLDANMWKNDNELVFGAIVGSGAKLISEFRDVTLHFKPISLKILPQNEKIQLKNYYLKDGVLKVPEKEEQRVYKELESPGRFYIKNVYSNVGNYQENPENPTVYRTDRIEFAYEYSDENPGGKYAYYDGFEVKIGGTWQQFYGTELKLNAEFFRKNGVIDSLYNGVLEIRPKFSRQSAGYFRINCPDTANGWLANAKNSEDKFVSVLTGLKVGDVIRDIKAQTRYASVNPIWSSRSMLGFSTPIDYDTTKTNVVIKSTDSNAVIDYHFEDVANALTLQFIQPKLIVAADPTAYNYGIKSISYKLDGEEYTWENFTNKMQEVYDDDKSNPLLEMTFNYNLSTAVKAHLNIYKSNGQLREVYHMDCSNGTFVFSGKPKDLGWEINDVAAVYMDGFSLLGTPVVTQETVINFLTNSRDGVTITLQSDTAPPVSLVGDINNPIIIENANPLKNYPMQAITSPGFTAAWYDRSPDSNEDGQVDPNEYDSAVNRLRELGFNINALDDIRDSKTYWGNNFTYTPKYFNPSRIYYLFEKINPVANPNSVWVKLYETFTTVLGNTSFEIPIKDAEVYINGKQISDSNSPDEEPDGLYMDTDPLYKNNNNYLGQLVYRGQTYNFAAVGGNTQKHVIITSDAMRPVDFKAYIDDEDQQLDIHKKDLKIHNGETRFEYRFDYAKAGVKPNASVVRIYGDVFYTKLLLRTQTDKPNGDLFSYTINTAEQGIKPGSTMTIAGAVTDNEGNILHEYPEVRVGFTFTAPLTGLSVVSSFKTPLQPTLSMLGKLNNSYDLGMDFDIEKKDKDISQHFKNADYTDTEGNYRMIRTVSYGFSDTYTKEFQEKTKDDKENEGKKGNKESLEEDTKDDEDSKDLEKNIKDKAANQKEKKSGGGDFQMPYKISVAVNLELGQVFDPQEGWVNDGNYYFSSLVIMATAEAKYKNSRTFVTPVGIPITVTLEAGGSASAVIAMDADRKDPYNEKYKLSSDLSGGNVSLNPANYDVYAKFILQPYVELSAGTEVAGVEVELSGRADFDFAFDVPIFGDAKHSSGSGGLVISSKLKLKIVFITKSWTLYNSKNIDLFSYGRNMQGTIMSALDNPYQNYLYESLGAVSEDDIMPRDYIQQKGYWNHEADEDLPQGVYEGNENVLQTGIFPHPQTKLIKLSDKKSLLLFVEDDISRSPRNRAALMYTIVEGDKATVPAVIDPDGTWDESPDAFLVGDRILVTWSDAGKAFYEEDTQIDVASSMNISGAWFDTDLLSFGNPFEITKTVEGTDCFADLNPKISYDDVSKRLMVYYTKIHYSDRWESFSMLTDEETVAHDQEPSPLYGDIVNGYNVIAYRYADFDEGINDFVWSETYLPEEGLDDAFYGQRFLDLAPVANIQETEYQINLEPVTVGEGDDAVTFTPTYTGTMQEIKPYEGLEDPRVLEMDVTTYDSRAVFAYIIDGDSDIKTQTDQQLFVQEYSFADNRFSAPIEISGSNAQNTQPHFVYQNDTQYLYWLRNGKLVYTSINALFEAGTLKEVTAPNSGKTFYIIDKANSSIDEHIITAIARENPISEYQIESDGSSVYAMWTEDCISLKDGIEEGAEGSDKPENINKERQIFAACNITDTENDQAFPWSLPVQVTCSEGQSFSDLSLSVLGSNSFVVAYARNIAQYDADAGCFDNDKSIRTLAVNTFTITSDLELGDISTGNVNPNANETVLVKSTLINTGLLPFKEYETQLYVKINGETYYESEWMGDIQGDNYILGGTEEIVYGHFIMPETLDNVNELKVGFRVKDSDGNILTYKESDMIAAPNIHLEITQSLLTGNGKASLSVYAENNGNKMYNGELTVVSGGKTFYTQTQQLAAGESKYITFDMDIGNGNFGLLQTAQDGSKFDTLPFTVQMGNYQATGELKREVSAEDFNAIENAPEFTVKNGDQIIANGSNVSVRYDEILSLTVTDGQEESDKVKRLETIWESSNPDVVTVLKNGLIVPMSKGKATVTATLQPISKTSYSYDDGSFDTISTPYTVPDGAKRKVSFNVTVNKGGSSSVNNSSSKTTENDAEGILLGDAKLQGDKLMVKFDDAAFAKRANGNKDTLTLSYSGDYNANCVEANLSENNLKALKESEINRLIINTTLGEIFLERKEIDALFAKSEGKTITFRLGVKGENIEITVKHEGGNLIDTDSGIIISVPYDLKEGEKANGILICQPDESGQLKPLRASYYHGDTGEILFKPSKCGNYVVCFNKSDFTDDLDWAEDYVTMLAARDIVKGKLADDGKLIFDPDNTVTRAEFIAMLTRLHGEAAPKGESPFDDVALGEWYAQPILWAFENQLVNGVGENKFAPNQNISREEMAVMLNRYMQKMNIVTKQNNVVPFTDEDTFSSFALSSIKSMQQSGIMVGTGENKFEPKSLTTRAEAAKVIAQILKLSLMKDNN